MKDKKEIQALAEVLINMVKQGHEEYVLLSLMENVDYFLTAQKQELKEKVEGMKKEIRYEELDTGIGIDRLEYDGQEKEHAYNQALSDIINLLK